MQTRLRFFDGRSTSLGRIVFIRALIVSRQFSQSSSFHRSVIEGEWCREKRH